MGNDNVTASPSGAFKTGNGLLNIAANQQEQFEAVCRVVGEPGWIGDPRFVDLQARLRARGELKGLLEAALASRPATQWWQRFNEAGVPAGPVYSVPEALAQPQIAERGMVATFGNAPGVGGDIRVLRTGFEEPRMPRAV